VQATGAQLDGLSALPCIYPLRQLVEGPRERKGRVTSKMCLAQCGLKPCALLCYHTSLSCQVIANHLVTMHSVRTEPCMDWRRSPSLHRLPILRPLAVCVTRIHAPCLKVSIARSYQRGESITRARRSVQDSYSAARQLQADRVLSLSLVPLAYGSVVRLSRRAWHCLES
jgi:hypothetical protein